MATRCSERLVPGTEINGSWINVERSGYGIKLVERDDGLAIRQLG